jgi:hypothetical protein
MEVERQTFKHCSKKLPSKEPTKENFNLPKSDVEHDMFISSLVHGDFTESAAEQAIATRQALLTKHALNLRKSLANLSNQNKGKLSNQANSS